MSYTYADRKRGGEAAPKKESEAAQPSFDALRSGAARPTQEQMGHRVDLPDVMRSKMENAFGADLSAVKLYESQAVADAGAKAITQGASIAFAPGLLDFTSFGGQALLGHEMSHVVSQARGEVTGSGLVNDGILEARADREGAMAAAGQTVAMPAASLSPVTAAAARQPRRQHRPHRSRPTRSTSSHKQRRSSTPTCRPPPFPRRLWPLRLWTGAGPSSPPSTQRSCLLLRTPLHRPQQQPGRANIAMAPVTARNTVCLPEARLSF